MINAEDRIKLFVDSIAAEADTAKGKRNSVVRMTILGLAYLIVLLVSLWNPNILTKGIISELEVLIAVYLTIRETRKGFILAMVLTGISLILDILFFTSANGLSTVSIVMSALFTAVVCSLIFYFSSNLRKRSIELEQQNVELCALYEEFAATEEELKEQNSKLLQYNDILQENERHINQLAYYDVLTELPNRTMVLNRIEFLIDMAEQKNAGFSIAMFDLDDFKVINDTMGHDFGDSLMREIAAEVSGHIRKDDMFGRFGGDEFIIVITEDLDEKELMTYVETLRMASDKLHMIDGVEARVSASFGVARYPLNGKTTSELLRYSDIAMHHAKDGGKNGVRMFNKVMNDSMIERIAFDMALANAIANEEMYLVFQPQFYLKTKQLRGYEALARWNSKTFGHVSPEKFIAVAEEKGYILSIGEWIIRQSCLAVNEMNERMGASIKMSVNISSVQLMEPEFLERVENILKETNVDPSCLEFEITESVYISAKKYASAILQKLRNMGIKIALDDFGTGYSSLSYLQILPIDTLKLDKSFIDKIGKNVSSSQIVGTFIDLMHRLDLSVVAEGVEDEHQIAYLKQYNCDMIQGYIWGRPMELGRIFETIEQIEMA